MGIWKEVYALQEKATDLRRDLTYMEGNYRRSEVARGKLIDENNELRTLVMVALGKVERRKAREAARDEG